MGYIKKLKNNELVGGTDKHTIYPVTSAEAVFEEVSDNEFKSQKYLNNHITNERIVDNTIENQKLKDDTIDMGKLNTQLKTIIQNAYDASWKVKEEPFSLETKYDANDVVYDPDTNSSYVSLTADNQGNPVNPEDEGYVEGKWRIIINGISAVESTEVINAKVEELETEVDNKIDDAQGQLDQMIADAAASLADAESDARGAAAEASAVVANKVADAQIGYFECNTATGTALKQTTLDYIGTGNDKSYYTIPAAGSNVRIKMKYANTASGTAELQFGTNTATRKQLIYSGEPASNSNSWDAGEVLSIYYDPTYNNNVGAYQASNAMGGGSAVGKKKLTGAVGYLATNGDTIGEYNSNSNYRYIKYPVSPGDVVKVSGKGATTPRLWAIADVNENIISKAESNLDTTDLVLTMPVGAKWIVLNNNISVYPNYEWYYAKAGSVGAHEMQTEAYLYGDLKTIAVGQTFEENEAVKTTDWQLLRINKEIGTMNLVDEVAVGDFKIYGSDANASTYKALKDVNIYDGTETEGLYAIGRPSLVTITVDSSSLAIEEDTDISITIGGVTNTITVTAAASETKDADIAALIAAAFTSIEGWVLTDNEDGTLTLKCNTAGNNTISVSSNTGETGLSITSSAVNGNSTLNQYNNGSWEDVTLAAFAGDYADIGVTDNTKMWQKLSIDDLVSLATVQNTLVKTAKAESISYNNSQSGFSADNVQEALDSTLKSTHTITKLNNDEFIYVAGVYIPADNVWTTHATNSCVMFPVKAGATYIIDASGAYAVLRSRGYLAGAVPQFADDYTGRLTQPKVVTIPRNSNANYLYIASTTTKGKNIGTITEILPNDIRVEEENKILVALDTSTYESTGTYFITSSGKWSSGNDNTGAFVPVTAGKRYRISNNVTSGRVFAWLKNTSKTLNASPNWATGNNARTNVAPGNYCDEVAPSDAAYLYIGSTGDLLTVYEIKDITFLEEQIDDIKSEIAESKSNAHVSDLLKYYNITSIEKINIDALTLRSCCIGSDKTWYKNTAGTNGKHKAIPVAEGEQFILIPSANSAIGWLDNTYNPPYSNGDAVPFVSGRVRETTYASATLLEVPAGASYLCITIVDGSGNTINWDVYRCTALNRFAGLLKFKYATWNVGHFAAYDGGGGSDDPTIPAEEVETMALRFKNVINDVSANVLNAIEYDKWFDAAGTIEAKDKIFSIYRALIGKWADSTSYYCCNAIFLDNSKFLNNSAADVEFDSSITAQKRYYRYDRCFIAGVETWFVAVHFEVGRQEYLEMQMAEMEQVIEQFSSCHHVVIAGDFNNHSSAMIQLFTEAGYTMANGGYLGWVPTSMAGNAIDNIAVKGFKMDNIQVNQESGTLSDHRLISCDLTLL